MGQGCCRLPRRSVFLVIALFCAVGIYVAIYSNVTTTVLFNVDTVPPTQLLSVHMEPKTVEITQTQREDADVLVVDQRPIANTKDATVSAMERLQKDIPNLPVDFLERRQGKKIFKRKDCARLPKLTSIEFSNEYWQTLVTPDRVFQFFSAYYDAREADDTPCVRIISMTNSVEPKDNFCQFWFEKSLEPLIVQVKSYHYIWRTAWGLGQPGSYQPYLITCQLPDRHPPLVPSAVSIVHAECDNATNILRVVNDKVEVKKDFAVCVKGLDFPDTDVSVRLVEWIELLSLLGNDKVYFYNLQTHPNVTKMLDYYEKKSLVSVIPMTLAGSQPNHPILQHKYLKENLMKKRHNEVITFNDCFYRNINAYKYVVVLDIDEVIMPVGNLTSWSQLIAAVEKKERQETGKLHASFYARNVYFLDNYLHEHPWYEDVPHHLHMLQHVYRSVNFTGPKEYVKSFFSTNLTLLVHNHLPIACLSKLPCTYPIPTDYAQMQHYREGCERSIKKTICKDMKENSVLDTSIWRFKDELIARSNRALNILGYSSEFLANLFDNGHDDVINTKTMTGNVMEKK